MKIGDRVLLGGKEAIILGFNKNSSSCVIEFIDGLGGHCGSLDEYWYKEDRKTPIPYIEGKGRLFVGEHNLILINSQEPQYEIY